MVNDAKIIRATLAAGADGYVLKESASGELLEAIPIVLAGRRFLSPTIRDAILEAQINAPEAEARSPFDQLGPREREILPMLVEGCTSAEIGNRLGLAASTVDTYRSRIMAKLQANSFAELIRMAIQHDIDTS
jgi:DNA-binding NarL/FixJ family response regulator